MPQAASLGFHPAGELDLGEPHLEEAGDERAHLVDDGRRGADALDLPRRLDGPLPHDGAADVLEGRLREELLEAAEQRHRQDVELQPEARRRTAVPLGDEPRKVLGRRQVLDRAERRLEAGALGDLAHVQRRLALGRHVQVRLLDRAGEVVEVGVLLQQGAVEPETQERGLQAGETGLELRRRRKHGARLDEPLCRPLPHAHITVTVSTRHAVMSSSANAMPPTATPSANSNGRPGVLAAAQHHREHRHRPADEAADVRLPGDAPRVKVKTRLMTSRKRTLPQQRPRLEVAPPVEERVHGQGAEDAEDGAGGADDG